MKIKASDIWANFQLFREIDLKGKTLLDIGGGKALTGFYYSTKLKRYVCVDTYEGHGNPKENFDAAIKAIKDGNIKNMEIMKSSLGKFFSGYTEHGFDIVLLSNVLHHIFPSPARLGDVVEYLYLAAKFLRSPGGLLLIREAMPLNISQLIGHLNKSQVDFSTKRFPNFWLRAIKKTHLFNKRSYEYHVPFKLKSLYPYINNLRLFRLLTSVASTSSYIIRAERA